MRKKIGLILMGAGIALLMAALSLLLYNRAEDEAAGSAADELLSSVMAAVGEPEGNSAKDGDKNGDKNGTDMTVVEIGGYGYIGYLSIPVLELELPVMSEWDYTKLKISPCRYFGSTKTNDLVICGHNYANFFGTLKNLREGDLVFFTDMDAVTTAYEVKEVETLQPTQISEMIGSGYDLTLYTCTYDGQNRVTVRCEVSK